MKSKYKAIIYIILSAFSFAFMFAFVRLSGDLPTVQRPFSEILWRYFSLLEC